MYINNNTFGIVLTTIHLVVMLTTIHLHIPIHYNIVQYLSTLINKTMDDITYPILFG